jgi:protein gp37
VDQPPVAAGVVVVVVAAVQKASVETADRLHRLDDLRGVPAAGRLLSPEPLLGAIGAVVGVAYLAVRSSTAT